MLFVKKNALQVLVPKYGLEGTIMLSDKSGKTEFRFNEEVSTFCIVIVSVLEIES